MYAYLTMTVGSRAGTCFLLDPAEENRLGRGTDCIVVLVDPLSSRVHAVVRQEYGQWRIRDAESRNGTYVNDQKVDEAVLSDGHHIRIGSTEFSFHESEIAPATSALPEINVTQTLVKNRAIGPRDNEPYPLAALNDPKRAHEMLLLYQLTIKLLGCASPNQVVRHCLELLLGWTHATVVGYLSCGDDGDLKPKQVIPEDQEDRVSLSKSLTEMVCDQASAVWIANQKAGAPDSLQHFADALCVPLVEEGKTLGAMHIYLQHGRFRQADFEFAISVANIAVVALVRARREMSLNTDYQHLVAQSPGHGELVGESQQMLDLKGKINRLGRATGCVLVQGESGCGKELVARALHRASPRADRPMLCVNCAAIPRELMESQLFGHKAGAFTSADRDHFGYFQQADQGTLFLDEVGEMSLEGQAKLLRILEGHPFMPVGSSQQIKVDVRVIAATNQDLQRYVKEKKFREDLYYRLSVFQLSVPPLRERGTDVGLLIDFFFNHFRRQHGRQGLKLSDAARQKLLAYQWPGNVRQLRNVLDSAVVLADGKEIEPGDLPLNRAGGGPELESLEIEVWERRLIAEALRRTAGNVPEAAKLLGIGRATLYRKMEQTEPRERSNLPT